MSKYASIPGMNAAKSPAPTPVLVAMAPTRIWVGVIPGPDALPPVEAEVEAVLEVVDVLEVVELEPEQAARRAAVARTTVATLAGVRRMDPAPRSPVTMVSACSSTPPDCP
jgi:hypothetical protein